MIIRKLISGMQNSRLSVGMSVCIDNYYGIVRRGGIYVYKQYRSWEHGAKEMYIVDINSRDEAVSHEGWVNAV